MKKIRILFQLDSTTILEAPAGEIADVKSINGHTGSLLQPLRIDTNSSPTGDDIKVTSVTQTTNGSDVARKEEKENNGVPLLDNGVPREDGAPVKIDKLEGGESNGEKRLFNGDAKQVNFIFTLLACYA